MLWMEPGMTLVRSSAVRNSWSRNSGLPSARSIQVIANAEVGIDGRRRESDGLVRTERAEIDGHERRATGCAAPAGVDRIALDA